MPKIIYEEHMFLFWNMGKTFFVSYCNLTTKWGLNNFDCEHIFSEYYENITLMSPKNIKVNF